MHAPQKTKRFVGFQGHLCCFENETQKKRLGPDIWKKREKSKGDKVLVLLLLFVQKLQFS